MTVILVVANRLMLMGKIQKYYSPQVLGPLSFYPIRSVFESVEVAENGLRTLSVR